VGATLDRRQLLTGGAAAAAAVPLLGAGRFDARPAQASGPGFTHGVASGDPSHRGVVLWTRVEGATDLTWRIGRDATLREIVAAGHATVEDDADGTVRVEVDGLEPGTTYWYGFAAGGRQSTTGRTRTLPGPGAARVRMAVMSCSNLETGWFNAYARVAERDDLDLVVHLGDYLYEYGDGDEAPEPLPGRAHHPRIELRSRADYRARYAQYRADADLQHLHSRHAVVTLFDDHELADDSWVGGAQAHGPEDGSFLARRQAAAAAWNEWNARRADRPQPWRAFVLGSLVDLTIVDGRSSRPRRGNPSIMGSGDDCLGGRQRRWLDSRLAVPIARWPLVLTQQPVLPRRGPDGDLLGLAGWSGFPAAQASLLDAVAAAGGLLVSGDVHSSWLMDTGALVEATVPSITSRCYADRHGRDAALAAEAALRRANPALRWVDRRHHGYLLVDATEERCRFEWWFVDTVLDRTAGQFLGWAFEVSAADGWR
jgi:alkaline phosphatase D